MPKLAQTPLTLKILGVAIAFIQVFDILIHAATNQLEFLRVTSNVIILIWLAVVASGRVGAKSLPIAPLAIGAYFSFNLIFLALEGLTNEGEVRGMLFLLVGLTVTLSTWMLYLLGQR